ncbi:MAG: hypothetical protein J0653_07110 [Deltaproteobacteria bacterium]|nr:hypothetical protein [Deltaproteobacteria bacterium]
MAGLADEPELPFRQVSDEAVFHASGLDLWLPASPDRLMDFIDEQGIKSGDTLWPCPVCGENNRWALLGELAKFALDLRPIERMVKREVSRTIACCGFAGRSGPE